LTTAPRRGVVSAVLLGGIANILHRDTIAMIVGGRTFERGEQCFTAGRVLGVEAARGELCGVVRPQERARSPYEVRIWIREDGLAYECTCPVGTSRQFCKHTVAIALAHLERQRKEAERQAERELSQLRARLSAIRTATLLDQLVLHARREAGVLEVLRQICDDGD
jgi:uncharacterized Zn finger protein